jgi:hypothetical protein
MAVAAASGTVSLQTYSNSAINSVFDALERERPLMDGEVLSTGRVSVQGISLTEFCEYFKIDKIDILKIDTQGFEREVLMGATKLLEQGRVSAVVCELLFAPLYKGQCRPGEVIDLLGKFGFDVFDFYDFVYDDQLGLKWGDAVLVRKT